MFNIFKSVDYMVLSMHEYVHMSSNSGGSYHINHPISHEFCRLVQLSVLDDLNANDLNAAKITLPLILFSYRTRVTKTQDAEDSLTSTLPTQSLLIYSRPLIVLVFSIKKTQM